MRSATLLALTVLSFAGFNALGAWRAWGQWRFLQSLPLRLPPGYLLARGAVWAVIFAALAFGLARRARWSRVGAFIAFPLYFAHGWIERLAFGRSEFSQTPLLWAALWTAFWIAAVWVTLWRARGVRRKTVDG